MKTKLIATLLLAGSSLFAGPRIGIGFGVGVGPAYVAPAPVYAAPAYVPPCPGPGYTFVDGYWVGAGAHRVWHAGYWAGPRFEHGYARIGRR